jgi:hypothetical protein
MAQFEVLYGRRCRTLLNWIEPGEKVTFRRDIVEEAEMIVHRVQENLKAAIIPRDLCKQKAPTFGIQSR